MKTRIQVTLSRRNLLTLLSKLDRVRDGGMSMCTLIKHGQLGGCGDVVVSAEEDAVTYRNRAPGYVMPWDNPDLKHQTCQCGTIAHCPIHDLPLIKPAVKFLKHDPDHSGTGGKV